jgi:hypothetical protein
MLEPACCLAQLNYSVYACVYVCVLGEEWQVMKSLTLPEPGEEGASWSFQGVLEGQAQSPPFHSVL